MSEVILINDNILNRLSNVIKEKCQDYSGKSVGIKVHVGEYGNLYNLRPQIVGHIVRDLIKIGAKPFVFDTNVKYPGMRNETKKHLENARRHGFTDEVLGCPFIISDEFVTLKSKYFDIGVSKHAREADKLIILSHGKGHAGCTGFGGAIKNIGMGFMSPETKRKLHMEAGPKLVGECSECGLCLKKCPKDDLISFNHGWKIDLYECRGCGICIDNCPNKALKNKVANLGELLTEATKTAIGGKDVFYINVCMGMSRDCDCAGNPELAVGPDVGITISDDPVALDAASMCLIENGCADFFAKMPVRADQMLDHAEKIGLGSKKFEVKN